MSLRNRRKTGKVTSIILFVSFIILIGRLIYVLPGAFEHHKQKKTESAVPVSVVKDK